MSYIRKHGCHVCSSHHKHPQLYNIYVFSLWSFSNLINSPEADSVSKPTQFYKKTQNDFLFFFLTIANIDKYDEIQVRRE